jgi:hypothetical protein
MKYLTTLTIEVEHDKPLPEGDLTLTDVVAQRAYQWLFNEQIPCDVTAKRIVVAAELSE